MKFKLFPILFCSLLAAVPALSTEPPARRAPEVTVPADPETETRDAGAEEKAAKPSAAPGEQRGKTENADKSSRSGLRSSELPYGAGYEARRGGGGQRRGGGRGR